MMAAAACVTARDELSPPKCYPSLIVPDNRGYYVLMGYLYNIEDLIVQIIINKAVDPSKESIDRKSTRLNSSHWE